MEEMNHSCGCGGNCKCKCECKKPNCKTCGRPFKTCECTKKRCCPKPCQQTRFCEYGRHANGCIRAKQPECPMVAVIPTVVVDTVEGIKELADCFVHVANINTTFYIDDKHRSIITWAGPVEYDDYDYENNPLKLRSQTVYDFANNLAIVYNKTGAYRFIELIDESQES